MMRVQDIMTTDVLTLESDASLHDAKELMTLNNFRHVPVMNEMVLIGILSQRDLLRAQSSSLLAQSEESRINYEKSVKLDEVCEKEVVTIHPRATLLEAAKYIRRHRLGCLPVVNGDELLGIITDSDFVNVAINLLEVTMMEDMGDNY